MKISSIFIMVMAVMFALTGCGNGQGVKGSSQAPGVKDVLEAGMTEESAAATGETAAGRQKGVNKNAPKPEADADAIQGSGEYDVDLTELSTTMIYSEVYNMMAAPDDYIGKTVKMQGQYAVYPGNDPDTQYHACVIKDATACCAQGIEFLLTDNYSYPEDYPQEGDDIIVSGVFDTYLEDGYTYVTLKDAQLID